MNSVNSLDKVIRKVDGNTKLNSGVTEKIIVLDKQTGDIVPAWKRLIGGNFLYYFVANNKDTSNFVESKGSTAKLLTEKYKDLTRLSSWQQSEESAS